MAPTRRPSECISLEVEGKKNSSPELLAVSNFRGRMLKSSVAVDLVVGYTVPMFRIVRCLSALKVEKRGLEVIESMHRCQSLSGHFVSCGVSIC